MLDIKTPSLLLTAACGLFLIIIGLWFHYSHRVRSVVSFETGHNVAKEYTKMLQVIISAQEPKDLYQVYGMVIDFKEKFACKIPQIEIERYCNDILEEKHKKAHQLITELIKKNELDVSPV